jgi:hypothetical protein
MTLPFGSTNIVIGAIVLGLLGLIECFFGYRVFRIILAILGFFVGAGIALQLISTNQPVLMVLVGIIGGLIGSLIFYYLYFIGTFLAGIALGATFGSLLAANLNVAPNVTTILVAIGAIIGGMLGLVLSKYIIMLSTAFTGAAQVIYAAVLLLPGTQLVQNATQVTIQIGQTQWLIMTLAILVLGAVGFAAQLTMYRRFEPVAPVAPVENP